VRVDRPDPADKPGDVGMAGHARGFDESDATGKDLEREASGAGRPGSPPALPDAALRFEQTLAYRARVEAVYRQYDIDHGHGAAKEPERETVTFGRRRVEAEDWHRHLQSARYEALDRPSYAASYRATVDAVYDAHQAEAAESAAWKTHDGDFCSWDDVVGGRGHSFTESAERQAYHVHYRALVEAEYKDAHWSRDSGQPTLRQPSARPEGKLLHADADPLRVFGPASETHPEEFQEAMTRLGEAGVEVDLRPGSMSYSPAAVGGRPGRLILDPEASYGAVLHEMSHFSDDELAGFPGLRYWLEDPTVTADGESRAYQVEIDYANSIGEPGIVDQLEELKAQRIGQLIGENDE
jgi:hypothetical protein